MIVSKVLAGGTSSWRAHCLTLEELKKKEEEEGSVDCRGVVEMFLWDGLGLIQFLAPGGGEGEGGSLLFSDDQFNFAGLMWLLRCKNLFSLSIYIYSPLLSSDSYSHPPPPFFYPSFAILYLYVLPSFSPLSHPPHYFFISFFLNTIPLSITVPILSVFTYESLDL